MSARGQRIKPTGFGEHFRRWVRAAGMQYSPALPETRIKEVPIVMVALPHKDVSDATCTRCARRCSARWHAPGAQLACVTVIASVSGQGESETQVHRQTWACCNNGRSPGLGGAPGFLPRAGVGDVAQALLRYAQGNWASIIVMGATHGLQMQRLIATVPIKVAMDAPCTTVLLVKQAPV